MRISLLNQDEGEVEESFASGSRLVNCRERMDIMRVYGVFTPGYGAIG